MKSVSGQGTQQSNSGLLGLRAQVLDLSTHINVRNADIIYFILTQVSNNLMELVINACN